MTIILVIVNVILWGSIFVHLIDERNERRLEKLSEEGKCYFVHDFYGNRDVIWTNKEDKNEKE